MAYKLRSFALSGFLLVSSAFVFGSEPDDMGEPRIEVFGDVESADHVAVFVPGAGWSADDFADDGLPMSPTRAAQTLRATARELDPDAEVAAIAWLGYRPPAGADLDAARSELAQAGASALAGLTTQLRDEVPSDASITLICHSYGSVVCGRAASGVSVDDIVVVGAAGMDADRVDDLDTPARVWAAITPDDGMNRVPGVRMAGFGHGIHPTDERFGARVFDTGGASGHSAYYDPDGETIRNLSAIVLGRGEEVTGA